MPSYTVVSLDRMSAPFILLLWSQAQRSYLMQILHHLLLQTLELGLVGIVALLYR